VTLEAEIVVLYMKLFDISTNQSSYSCAGFRRRRHYTPAHEAQPSRNRSIIVRRDTKMHSFIRTYPSLASAASGSAASSSSTSRLGEEDENGSICCDIYIDGEDNSQPQKGGSSTSSKKPLHVAAVLRGRGIPPEPAPEPERRRICSCWRLTLIIAAIVVGAIVLGVSIGESCVKAAGEQPNSSRSSSIGLFT
jgi:hypothetical protein